MNQSLNSSNTFISIEQDDNQQYSESHIFYAYLISGVMVVMAACFLLMNLCINTKEDISETIKKKDPEKTEKYDELTFKIPFLIGVFLFYVSYCGLESNFGNYVATYAVEDLSFTKNNGARVTAVYSMGYTVGRACGIFVIKIMTPRAMLSILSVLSFLSLLALLLLAGTHPVTLWVSSAAVGLSMAPIFPAAMTWSSQYVDITGHIGLIFNIAFAVGEMTTPIILNFFYGSYGMTSFVYIMLIASCFELFFYILLEVFASYHRGKYMDYHPINGDVE